MKKHFVVSLLMSVSIYLSSYAEISKYEFNIDPNTPCILVVLCNIIFVL